jgi:phage terminase large subunit-like protein
MTAPGILESLEKYSPDQLLEQIDKTLEHHKLQNWLYGKDYKPNKKQLEFHATGLVAQERAFFAGNRTGKSMSCALEVSKHLTGCYGDDWNGYRYTKPIRSWAAGITNTETHETLKRYYLGDQSTLGFIHPSLIVDRDLQKHIYYIRHISGGVSKLRFKSYEQREGAWQAETLDLIHLDEEPPPKIYSEAVTRTASTSPDHHGMILLSMTPLKGVTSLMLKYMQSVIFDDEGNEVETKKVAPLEVHNSRVYVLASHDDADHLTDKEKKRLYLSYSPEEREARTKGIPSLGSGLVYPVREELYVISPIQIPDYWPRCYGLDFGWHHPTAAVFLAHDQDNDVVYAYAEYAANRMTPQHHAYELIKQGADWMPGAYDYAGEATAATDGANVVDLYKQAGLRSLIPADKRSVSKGIYTILQRMENGKFKVFSNLTKLLTEIRMYSRDENGKINKGNDDLLDAMRYGITTALPIARIKNASINKYKVNNQYSQGAFVRF